MNSQVSLQAVFKDKHDRQMLLKSSGTSSLSLAKFPWALLCRLAKAKVICLPNVFSPHYVTLPFQHADQHNRI